MRSLLKNRFILITILLSILAGCRKDTLPEIEPPVDDTTCQEVWCDEIPPPTSMIGWQIVITGPQYVWPMYNPNNSDEFVFIRDNGSGNTELVKYTTSNSTEEILCNSLFIVTPPQWGKLGWICFTSIDKKIWKIKEDGTQLTQLTFGEKDRYPSFSFIGDKIYYSRGKNYTNYELEQNPDLYLESKMFVIDLNGNVADSVLIEHINSDNIGIYHYQKWTNAADIEDNVVYFCAGTYTYNNYGIYSLDLVQETMTPIHTWNPSLPNQQHLSYLYYYDGFIYFTKFRKGIFKVEVNSGIETQIRIGCGMRYYEGLSISPDGTKMLVEKVTTTVLNEYELDEQREIWLLDLVDGCKMEQVLGE